MGWADFAQCEQLPSDATLRILLPVYIVLSERSDRVSCDVPSCGIVGIERRMFESSASCLEPAVRVPQSLGTSGALLDRCKLDWVCKPFNRPSR